MTKCFTKTEADTFNLGLKLGKKIRKAEVLALSGDLGAGKTKFLQGFARGLGVKAKVNSPTFNILKLYKVYNNDKIKIFCHVDAYRLTASKDLISLGIEEYINDKKTVVAIEWAEKVKGVFPHRARSINIRVVDEMIREICLK